MSTLISLCRLCGENAHEHLHIFKTTSKHTEIAAKMVSCLQIMTSTEDVLPQMVCVACLVKLDSFYDFLQKAHKTQSYLQKMHEEEFIAQKCEALRESENCNKSFQCNMQLHVDNNDDDKLKEHDENRATLLSQTLRSDSEESKLTSKRFVTTKMKTMLAVKTVAEYSKNCTTVRRTLAQRKCRLKKSNKVKKFYPQFTQIFQDYPWSCTMCDDMPLYTFQELCHHYKIIHGQDPIFKCISCDKQYIRYKSFTKHVQLHQKPDKYACDICGKTFGQRTVLLSHNAVHNNTRPHICVTCGKSFKNSSSLYVHNKSHIPDAVKEKFVCSLCKKKFSTKYTLKLHHKMHTGERNFMCDICGKSFIAKGSLAHHILSHTDNKNYKCSNCERAFKTGRLLNKHKILHTVIKSHQCDICGKQFRKRDTLREHNRIHTGAMPYSCEFCGKTFRFSGILTIHRRQHTGERPYACTECPRDFTNWANYNKHMKRIHNSKGSKTS